MPINPLIPLMGRSPTFSLLDFGEMFERGQRLRAGSLDLREQERAQQEAEAVRQAYTQQYGGGGAPAGLLGAQPMNPRAPASYGPALTGMLAQYQAEGAPVSPQPGAEGAGGQAGQAGQRGLAGAGPMTPGDRQGQRAFLDRLYTISPKAGREAEKHAYDSQDLQLKQHIQRVDYLGRVADGVLESDNPQAAWEVARAMLIEQGMPPGQAPEVYDPNYVRQLSGMGHDAGDKLRLAQAELYRAQAQRERGKAPDYGLGDDMNQIVYEMFGTKIEPGQKPTPGQVAQAREYYQRTDPQSRLTRAKATREEAETEALRGVQAVEPGGAGAPPTASGTAPEPLNARQQHIARLIRAEAERQGVDPELAVAVARQESGLDPEAVGDGGKSVGVFQLQEKAAKDAGIDPRRRSGLQDNIRGGVGYLKQQMDKEDGNIDRALSRYNRGTPDYQGRGDPRYVENVRRYYPPAGAAQASSGAPQPETGRAQRAGQGTGAGVRQQRSPGADSSAVSSLAADEQRLRVLEEQRKRQEEHVKVLQPYATSEAGSKRLQQGERVLSRLQGEIDTLRTRLEGPAQEAQKTAAREEAQRESLRGQTTAETLKEHAPQLYDVTTATPINPSTPYGDVLEQQRAGTVKQLSKRQAERLEVAREAVPVLAQMVEYTERIFGAGGELESANPASLDLLIKGTLTPRQMQEEFPLLTEAARFVDANAGNLARGLKGETGAMSEGDVDRSLAGLPNFRSVFKLGLGLGGAFSTRGVGPAFTVKPEFKPADTARVARGVLESTIDTLNSTTGAILGQPGFRYPELAWPEPVQGPPAPSPTQRQGPGTGTRRLPSTYDLWRGQ